MSNSWPSLAYDDWSATCDTLHAHTQVLGKLCVALAPPEPQLQHAALRLTARGWETPPLPAPDGSGAFVVALDLHAHEAVAEHSDGGSARIALGPDRSVGEVTRELLGAVRTLAGAFEIAMNPQEVPWTVPFDEDAEHATYDPAQVATYFAAATQAALVLAEFRAPYRGRSTPVNAWWGSFDLAVNLFSGAPADPPAGDFIMRNAMDAQEVAVGWWPGDARYGEAAVLRVRASRARRLRGRHAVARGRALGRRSWGSSSWTRRTSSRPPTRARTRSSSRVRHSGTRASCASGNPTLPASVEGDPPPVRSRVPRMRAAILTEFGQPPEIGEFDDPAARRRAGGRRRPRRRPEPGRHPQGVRPLLRRQPAVAQRRGHGGDRPAGRRAQPCTSTRRSSRTGPSPSGA